MNITFGNQTQQLKTQLLTERDETVTAETKAKKAAAEKAKADAIVAKFENTRAIFDQTFDNGVTGKQVLTALFVELSDQNWLTKKVRGNRPVKLNLGNVQNYFSDAQTNSVFEVIKSLSNLEIENELFSNQAKSNNKGILRPKAHYSEFGGCWLQFSKFWVTQADKDILETVLKEKGVINDGGTLDLSIEDNY